MNKKLDFSLLDNAKVRSYEYTEIDNLVTSEFLKSLRKKLNMTQQVFSSVLGITKKTVEKWEQGKNPIKGLSARLLYLLDINPKLLECLYSVSSNDCCVKEQMIYTVETPKTYKREVEDYSKVINNSDGLFYDKNNNNFNINNNTLQLNEFKPPISCKNDIEIKKFNYSCNA